MTNLHSAHFLLVNLYCGLQNQGSTLSNLYFLLKWKYSHMKFPAITKQNGSHQTSSEVPVSAFLLYMLYMRTCFNSQQYSLECLSPFLLYPFQNLLFSHSEVMGSVWILSHWSFYVARQPPKCSGKYQSAQPDHFRFNLWTLVIMLKKWCEVYLD